MALVIHRSGPAAEDNHLGPRGKGFPARAVPGVNLPQRDKQGVYALSLVAEGEACLQGFLRQAEEKGGISGREEAFFASAREEVRKIVEKSPEEETGRVVARQLEGSLDAFRIRSRDLALREHLSYCDSQIRQRRNDVRASVAGLAETARSAPDPELRQKALQAVQSQVTALRQVEKAMALAKSRYAGGERPAPEPAAASTRQFTPAARLSTPTGMRQTHEETL